MAGFNSTLNDKKISGDGLLVPVLPFKLGVSCWKELNKSPCYPLLLHSRFFQGGGVYKLSGKSRSRDVTLLVTSSIA
ncbi:MAG: hypothetical protein ACTSWN_03105 [Promethearchaeota archaeon]